MDDLRVREAELRDSDELLRWRNDPVAVETSVSRSTVAADEHAAWLDRTLADPKRVLLIGEDAQGAVGTCRFDVDLDGTSAEVSVNVAPERRGTGLAAPLLTAGMTWIAARMATPLRLEATIRTENIASVRLFTRLGFVEVRSTIGFTRLERSLGAAPAAV